MVTNGFQESTKECNSLVAVSEMRYCLFRVSNSLYLSHSSTQFTSESPSSRERTSIFCSWLVQITDEMIIKIFFDTERGKPALPRRKNGIEIASIMQGELQEQAS